MSVQTFHGDNDDLGGLSLHEGVAQHFCVSHLIFTTTLIFMFLFSVLQWDLRGWVACPRLHSWGLRGLI